MVEIFECLDELDGLEVLDDLEDLDKGVILCLPMVGCYVILC